jgi:low temperature requirement protein LtrA
LASVQNPGALAESEEQAERERHATWLELFFDLLFVAVVALLAHGLSGQVTAAGLGRFAGLLLPVWWAWVSFTYMSDVADDDTPPQRVRVLAGMACLVVMAGGITRAEHGHPGLFALGYGLFSLGRAWSWRFVAPAGDHPRPKTRDLTRKTVSAALWLAAVAVPAPACFALWTVALLLDVVPSFRHMPRAVLTLDAEHLVERFGLFVIIVLGEGVAQIVTVLGRADTVPGGAVLTVLAAFLLLAVIWWLYFDFGNEAALVVLRARPEYASSVLRWGFAAGHLPIVGAVTALAAGLGTIAGDALTGHRGADQDAVRLVCGALAVYMLTNAALATFLVRFPIRQTARWLVPDLVVFGVVALAAGRLPAVWVPVILASALVAGAMPGFRRRAAARAGALPPGPGAGPGTG